MYARNGFFGSIAIPLTKRPGLFDASVSIRVNVTSAGFAASAFRDTNTRPVDVATHIVEWSLDARAIAATSPPARSLPYWVDVRSPGLVVPWSMLEPKPDGSPSGARSPQPGWPPNV